MAHILGKDITQEFINQQLHAPHKVGMEFPTNTDNRGAAHGLSMPGAHPEREHSEREHHAGGDMTGMGTPSDTVMRERMPQNNVMMKRGGMMHKRDCR